MTFDAVQIPSPEERVRRRLAMGLSQGQLAELSATHRVNVGKWERGETPLASEESIRYLEVILGLQIDPPTCKGCGDTGGMVPGFQYCVGCRGMLCSACGRRGGHHPTCARGASPPPRMCKGCGDTAGMVPRYHYCVACRSMPPCLDCTRTVGHHPKCPRRAPRRCSVCSSTDGMEDPLVRFCRACFERPACATCGCRPLHHAQCPERRGATAPPATVVRRVRRAPAPRCDVVTHEDVLRIYVAYRLDLLKRAAAVVGFDAAQDVVQEAVADVVCRLPTLAYLNVNYFRRAVRTTALLTIRRWREVSVGDFQDLTAWEERAWRAEHGQHVEAR